MFLGEVRKLSLLLHGKAENHPSLARDKLELASERIKSDHGRFNL